MAGVLKDHRRVIFTGNGYSSEWPVEAEKRGLPNLADSVQAAEAFSSEKSKALFDRMKIFSGTETDARQECMFENYAAVLETEAVTLLEMVRTGVEPAMAQDLALYGGSSGSKMVARALAKRTAAYDAVSVLADSLEEAMTKLPSEAVESAKYCAASVKPLLLEIQTACNEAEGLCKKELWPYPDLTDVLYTHQMNSPKSME